MFGKPNICNDATLNNLFLHETWFELSKLSYTWGGEVVAEDDEKSFGYKMSQLECCDHILVNFCVQKWTIWYCKFWKLTNCQRISALQVVAENEHFSFCKSNVCICVYQLLPTEYRHLSTTRHLYANSLWCGAYIPHKECEMYINYAII